MTWAEQLDQAERFLWLYGRVLERQAFATLFRGAAADGAIQALRGYQNADGGFGHGLEPDKRVPHSQPVDIQLALEYLDVLGAFEVPWLEQVLEGLERLTTAEGGVPFATVEVNQYPHAPWWGTPDHPPAALNPTAAIVGLLVKHNVSHPWIERASGWCWKQIQDFQSTEFHDVMPVMTYLMYVDDQAAAATQIERIGALVLESGKIAFDATADGYVHGPLDWAPAPEHALRGLFTTEQIQQALDHVHRQQQPDGGWPISWQPISPGVAYEWRGLRTLQVLHTLHSYAASPATESTGVGGAHR